MEVTGVCDVALSSLSYTAASAYYVVSILT